MPEVQWNRINMDSSRLPSSASTKRNRDSTAPDAQQRSRKRAKYTQVACNECKRRKLKCSGEPICWRCSRDGARCVYTSNSNNIDNESNALNRPGEMPENDSYKLSNQFKAVCDKLAALQRETLGLTGRIKELEAAAAAAASTSSPLSSSMTPIAGSASQVPSKPVPLSGSDLGRILNAPRSPTFVGPTSAEFGLAAASGLLDPHASGNESEDGSGRASKYGSEGEQDSAHNNHQNGDPLVSLGQAQALRLIEVYEDVVGIMYPCVDLESVREYTRAFCNGDHASVDASPKRALTLRGGLVEEQPLGESGDQDWFYARDVQVLKLILAIALLAESHGRSERAAQLADSVEDIFATRLKIATVDMKEVLILTLLSIFHSYRDDEVYAWRLSGMAIRGCMEIGLHCQETWSKSGGCFSGELRSKWASRLWWCLYVLDRQFSFGTGLPASIQDSDMDTDLPGPGDSSPYLTCMISYARLIPKIWNFVVGWRRRPRVRTTDTCSYLDYQVRVWVQSIPPDLQFDPTWRSLSGPRHTGRVMTLQVLLALQANHLRILLYRQNLLNSSYIEMDVSGASTAVEAAKNTIHMIDYFSQVVPVYFQRPEPFNYFLLSALAALFLAVLHAPARFSQVCRSEFYMAVDLVRRSSTRVETSRRLQKIIRSLKLIQRNLNLEQGKSRSGNRSSKSINATTTPGTPSSHDVGVKDIHPQLPVNPQIPSLAQLPSPDEAPIFPALSPVTGATAVGIGDTSCDDLTNFFEIAGAYFLEPRETTTPAPAPDIGGQMNTSTLCCDAVRDNLDNGDSNLLRVSTDIGNPVDGVDFSQFPGMEFFQAEDESLTQLVAGLL